MINFYTYICVGGPWAGRIAMSYESFIRIEPIQRAYDLERMNTDSKLVINDVAVIYEQQFIMTDHGNKKVIYWAPKGQSHEESLKLLLEGYMRGSILEEDLSKMVAKQL